MLVGVTSVLRHHVDASAGYSAHLFLNLAPQSKLNDVQRAAASDMSGDCQLSNTASTLGSIESVSASIPGKVVCVDHRHYKSQMFIRSSQTRWQESSDKIDSAKTACQLWCNQIGLAYLIILSTISMSAAGSNGTGRSRRAQSNRASDSGVPSPAGDAPRPSRRRSFASGQTATSRNTPAVSANVPPEDATEQALRPMPQLLAQARDRPPHLCVIQMFPRILVRTSSDLLVAVVRQACRRLRT